MKIKINDEVSRLETVIIGLGIDYGTRDHSINPIAQKHLEEGTFPFESSIVNELNCLEYILLKSGIKVYKPINFKGVMQIFVRDIGFVIEDKFFISNMNIKRGLDEIDGIKHIIDFIPQDNIVENLPKEVMIEGGDVIVAGDNIFIGKSSRTNDDGFKFIKEYFKNKNVVQVELDHDPNSENYALHLDCAFQPISNSAAIICESSITNPQIIKNYYLNDSLIYVSRLQANRMFTNILSIGENRIIIEKGFFELEHQLLEKGFDVLKVDFKETSKLGGLLRCSTLPLLRS